MSLNYTPIDDLVDVLDEPSPFFSYGPPESLNLNQIVEGIDEYVDEEFNRSAKKEEESVRSENQKEEIEKGEHFLQNDEGNDGSATTNVATTQSDDPHSDDQTNDEPDVPEAHASTHLELPISDDEILKAKKEPITSSLRWLGEFCIYLLRQVNIQLKDAQGKATRIIIHSKNEK